MIECTDSNVWYNKKKKRHKSRLKRYFVSFLTVLIIFGIFTYYKLVVSKSIFNYCYESAYAYATESVNNAVLTSLLDDVKYDDLVVVEKNLNGDITLINADTVKVNYISRKISETTAENLRIKMDSGVMIPALAFTGIDFLSGYGGKIPLKLVNVVNVKGEFISTFSSVGINQTLHSLYISVISTVSINIPLNQVKKECETKILISESVLVGKVPEIYLNGSMLK